MFADDIVICHGELGARKKKIWRCRSMPWEEGIKVGCRKMEYMFECTDMARLQAVQVQK